MVKRMVLIGFMVLVLAVPAMVCAVEVPSKVYENRINQSPMAVSGVKVEVFGGFQFKALLSSEESDASGSFLIRNVPLGKDVIVKLSKTGYVTQYDVKNFSEESVEQGAIFWVGSGANLQKMYGVIGETFDITKGQVYLEINNELTGEGIEGVQFSGPSGNVYDLGQGEYLIANVEGASLKVGIQKPGFAFDIESVTIPLFPGGMTQYYVNVQSGGAMYDGKPGATVTSVDIFGYVRTLTNAPISGASVAFTNNKGQTVRPTVNTNKDGFYKQKEFPVNKMVKLLPTKSPFKFKAKLVFVGKVNKQVDLKESK